MITTNLDAVLAYSNPLVIARFKINHPAFSDKAERLFLNMLKYLWLCNKYEQDISAHPERSDLAFIPVMHEEMRQIDNMWHEFILITRDYHDFCYQHFGKFLHHVPNMREELKLSEEEFTEQLSLFLAYIYETLGEETLTEWFSEHLTH